MYREKTKNHAVYIGEKNKKIRRVFGRKNIKKKDNTTCSGKKKNKKHTACIGKSTDISEYFVMGRAQIIILIT